MAKCTFTWLPKEMRVAAKLNQPPIPVQEPRKSYALLINPFYPKDPHASLGKHVLTPTLAATTSIAAATPVDWEVRYWDENLLQGPPPSEPFPEVVGITVHLTFALRAYELARWYRERGAKVVLGGLHVMACADEAGPHADALALGEGVQIWGQILRDVAAGKLEPVYRGNYREPYAPRSRCRAFARLGSGAPGFLTTTSLIATRRDVITAANFATSRPGWLAHMPYQMRWNVEQIAAEFRSDDQHLMPCSSITISVLGRITS